MFSACHHHIRGRIWSQAKVLRFVPELTPLPLSMWYLLSQHQDPCRRKRECWSKGEHEGSWLMLTADRGPSYLQYIASVDVHNCFPCSAQIEPWVQIFCSLQPVTAPTSKPSQILLCCGVALKDRWGLHGFSACNVLVMHACLQKYVPFQFSSLSVCFTWIQIFLVQVSFH